MAEVRATGKKVAWVHVVHLNPFPSNLGELLHRYPKIIVPEMNLGQLCKVVRSEFLVPAKAITKVQGMPFTSAELRTAIEKELS